METNMETKMEQQHKIDLAKIDASLERFENEFMSAVDKFNSNMNQL